MNTNATCDHGLLRGALLANAVFSLSCGLGLLLATDTIGQVLGQVSNLLLWVIGCGLLIFASDILYRLKRGLGVGRVWYFIINDILWVLGSLVVLVMQPTILASAGLWLIAVIAAIVGTFAVLQFVGLQLGLKQANSV